MARPLVLLVEDEPSLAEVTADLLELDGHRVVTARHGAHALTLLDTVAPDLIVTDLMMPVMDGLEFLRRYAARADRRAPVLVPSAFEGWLPAALALGASAALAKPVNLPVFEATVRQLLEGGAVRPPPPTPAGDLELERLAEVLELQLDRPGPTDALDQLARRVAEVFEVPICLVSIVTRDRQYWHAHCGLPDDLAAARGTPREQSFCAHPVAAQAPLVVQDVAAHPLFRDNVLVREHGLRFYAGVPLVTRHGHALGTLCLLDLAPHRFTRFDLALLGVLARRVLAELEWRERRLRPGLPRGAFQHLSWFDGDLGAFSREGFAAAVEALALRAVDRREPLVLAAFEPSADEAGVALDRARRALPRALFGRLAERRLGVAVPGGSAAEVAAALRQAAPRAAVEALEAPQSAVGGDALLHELERRAQPASLSRPPPPR